MLSPRVEVILTPNRVAVRNAKSGAVASVDAPFSCSQLLADEIEILEHATRSALAQVMGRSRWIFPHLEVSTAGRPLFAIERKAIEVALANAGASRVSFEENMQIVEEQKSERAAYVARHRNSR